MKRQKYLQEYIESTLEGLNEIELYEVATDLMRKTVTDKELDDWIDDLRIRGFEEEEIYSVYVGSEEVNDYNLTLEQAKIIAEQYKNQDYTDVVIYNLRTSEEV